MYEVTKQFHFSAAHMIDGHPKCGRMHGHNYVVTIGLRSKHLTDGMVMDYGELARKVQPLVDLLDHHFICSNANRTAGDSSRWAQEDAVYLDIVQSTAECLAKWFWVMLNLLPASFVTVAETDGTTATFYVEEV